MVEHKDLVAYPHQVERLQRVISNDEQASGRTT
jgi:hypothetical protein